MIFPLRPVLVAILLQLFGTSYCNDLKARAAVISPPNLPFGFEPLFTVRLNVGTILAPLAIPGGVLVNEPITGGTVSGSAINGTILSGFAHPSVYGNGTLQVPNIDVYGMTEDGESFYIHEEGIGFGSAQVTRIVRTVPPLATD